MNDGGNFATAEWVHLKCRTGHALVRVRPVRLNPAVKFTRLRAATMPFDCASNWLPIETRRVFHYTCSAYASLAGRPIERILGIRFKPSIRVLRVSVYRALISGFLRPFKLLLSCSS